MESSNCLVKFWFICARLNFKNVLRFLLETSLPGSLDILCIWLQYGHLTGAPAACFATDTMQLRHAEWPQSRRRGSFMMWHGVTSLQMIRSAAFSMFAVFDVPVPSVPDDVASFVAEPPPFTVAAAAAAAAAADVKLDIAEMRRELMLLLLDATADPECLALCGLVIQGNMLVFLSLSLPLSPFLSFTLSFTLNFFFSFKIRCCLTILLFFSIFSQSIKI